MGRVGAPYTFNVNKMLEMRVLGYSYSALGRYFHKDHTTILYHCKKWGIVPLQRAPTPPELPENDEPEVLVIVRERKILKYPDPFEKDGPINPGKSYKEYIAESLKRTTERNYHKTYYEHYPDIRTSSVAPYPEETGAERYTESA